MEQKGDNRPDIREEIEILRELLARAEAMDESLASGEDSGHPRDPEEGSHFHDYEEGDDSHHDHAPSGEDHHHRQEFVSDLPHTHVLEDGTVITHTHAHRHTHTHQNKRAVINRLSRIIGHLESIRRMVEDDRDCSEVLIQISAVQSALKGASRVILHDHISHCIVDAVESGDMQAVEDMNKAIDQLLK